MKFVSREEVRHAKTGLANALGQVRGIAGVGIGKCDGDYCVRVTVTNDAAAKHVPKRFDGVPVEVTVSGEFSAHPAGSVRHVGSYLNSRAARG